MSLIIRPITSEDNAQMAKVIREVMPEFGAVGPGFAIVDPQVDHLYEAYLPEKSCYFVVEKEDEVLGGAGIGPLVGESTEYCELQKMYFKAQLRGQGLGQKMLELCLEQAREFGYRYCYIETLEHMTSAQGLYLKNGFKKLKGPVGETGHFKCDSWFLKTL